MPNINDLRKENFKIADDGTPVSQVIFNGYSGPYLTVGDIPTGGEQIGDVAIVQIPLGLYQWNGSSWQTFNGLGIDSVILLSGDHSQGTLDTYRMTFTDTTYFDYQVYNGADGAGTGDVIGPASSVDGNFASFDLTSGKEIKDSGKNSSSFAPALGNDDNYVTDLEKIAIGTISGKEDTSNKSNNIITDGASNTKYPSVKAIKDYADGLVVGLLDYRGAYDASVNTYPTTGGSGDSGAIMKGDMFIISVSGTLGGIVVKIGDAIIANIDSPGQTTGNWNILNGIMLISHPALSTLDWLNSGHTGTAYNLPVFNASGVAAEIAPGTTGNVLTSNGSAWVSSAPAGGGSAQIEPLADYSGQAVIGTLGTFVFDASKTLSKCTITCDSIPTGSNLILELRKNSYTSGNILSSTLQVATSDTLTNGKKTVSVTGFSTATVVAGDYVVAYLTSVGSTLPANNPVCNITFS